MSNNHENFELDQLVRCCVVGVSGSGKSTFARRLACQLGLTHIEMDALYWKADWQQSSNEEFLEKLDHATTAKRWVTDGNYGKSDFIKFDRAASIIWIDFGFFRTFSQALRRATKRIVTQQEVWPGTGNRETISKTFFSHDSILLWTITSYRQVRKRYLEVFANPKYKNKQLIRIQNPVQMNRFFRTLDDKIVEQNRQYED